QHLRGVSEWLFVFFARRNTAKGAGENTRFGKCPHVPARLCHRVRLLSAPPAAPHAGDTDGATPLFCWPDKRYHGLRRSRSPGFYGGNKRCPETERPGTDGAEAQ